MRHRAQLDVENIAGLTPYQLAERCKRTEIAVFLLDVENQGYSEPAASAAKVLTRVKARLKLCYGFVTALLRL